MKNTKHILAITTILMLTNCSSYRGAYHGTSYMDQCDAKDNLQVKADMHPNISKKHKSLYSSPHVNLADYTNPNVAKSKETLPKYRLLMKSDVNRSYDKITSVVTKLNYKIIEANKAEKYIIISVNKNEEYKIKLEKFNDESILYVLNKQNKIVLQSKLKELFKNIIL